MDVNELIEFLKSKDSRWSSRSHLSIEHNFEIKPQDFLSYAESDLANNYSHNLINCLSNSKRALDCQVDILLIGFGFYSTSKSKRWGFPKKIEIIKELGIVAPRVLLKINKVRNLMEHEFSNPTKEQVEDFVDIVSLFIASTDKFIFDFPDDLEIENEDIPDLFVRFKSNYQTDEIFIEFVKRGNKESQDFLIRADKIEYSELLKQILRIGLSY